MASKVLYPPIVDSYMPAFLATSNNIKIYYRLSKFNAGTDIKSVHISIVKQGSGANIVNTNNSDGRYRATGIILNVSPQLEGDNLYSVTISPSDLKNNAWDVGWIYKVQLRLSAVSITNSSENQAQWLVNNASNFSEWSTVCTLTAIGPINYKMKFNILTEAGNEPINTKNEKNGGRPFNPEAINELNISSTLSVFGTFIEPGDVIYSYQFILYDVNNTIVDDSGEKYLNKNQIDNLSFQYTFKTELKNKEQYYLAFKFTTRNKFIGGFYNFDSEKEIDTRYSFICNQTNIGETPCRLIAVENDTMGLLSDISSVSLEEDEGRIALKFYSPNNRLYSGNLCIRRSDSKTNFTEWEDIYICPVKQSYINSIPVFYDYTIESGIYYKYGVQEISPYDDSRTKLEILSYPIMRNFNYSFILGKNGKQLKLMFDNTMTNFKYQIADSRSDAIGNKYTNITRNAATYYRTFPINGLISFWMDDNNLFCNKSEIYKYEDIIELYNSYNSRNNIVQYDYIYEREFRNQVLDFLQDGEIKLFKSPTEGNIIIRLMDVNCIPNQSLGRMIYSFTSNAFEMDAPTMENYLKYGFYFLNDLETDFSVTEIRIGQIQMDFNNGDNIFDKIKEKYDTTAVENINGYVIKVGKIYNLKITFDDKPLRIKNNQGELVLGNNIQRGNDIITIYASNDQDKISPGRIYEFDECLVHDGNTPILILSADISGYSNNSLPTVHATIDFLYEAIIKENKGKELINKTIYNRLGQIYESCKPNKNFISDIYYDWYWETQTSLTQLQELNFIEIEADPGTVFYIQDKNDEKTEKHIIGATGILRLYHLETITSLQYIGVQDFQTGSIKAINSDIIINYGCTIVSGTLKEVT